MGDHNLSSLFWVRMPDTGAAILDKLNRTAAPGPNETDKIKLLDKLRNQDKYIELRKDDAFIPKVFYDIYDDIKKDVGKNVKKSGIKTVENLFKRLRKGEKSIDKADNTLSKVRSFTMNLDGIFEVDDDRYTFINPLNYFMRNWNYDGELSKNVIESSYTYLYDEFLNRSSDDERVVLGCEEDPEPTKNHHASSVAIIPGEGRRMIMEKHIVTQTSQTSTTLHHVSGQKYYPCKKLIARMDPFVTSRVIDLTIPSITPLYVDPSHGKSMCLFIHDLFYENVPSTIPIKTYFPDFPANLNFDVIKDLSNFSHNYIPLEIQSNGRIGASPQVRYTIPPEVIRLFDNDAPPPGGGQANSRINLYIVGNLFRLFDKTKSTLGGELKQSLPSLETIAIKNERDKVYSNPISDSVLKNVGLKFKDQKSSITVEEIRSIILFLYSIYTKQGLDYDLSHKHFGEVGKINRKIAKELLYLALFTFYNYLEHVVFKSIKDSIKGSKLDKNIKKNFGRYFDNILSLIRTNTVILFGYDKTSINVKENYGIKRGQNDKIVSGKGEYFRVDNGYVNSKLDEGDDLVNFMKHFPFKIKKSTNENDIVFSIAKKTGSGDEDYNRTYFTYNPDRTTINNIKNVDIQVSGSTQIPQNMKLDRDIYIVNKSPTSNDNLEIKLKNNIGTMYYLGQKETQTEQEPTKTSEGSYGQFDIKPLTNLPEHSYTIYDKDDSEAKNIAMFMSGTENSIKDLVSGKKLGFGVLPYGVDDKLTNRNEILYNIYIQYCMNVLSHVDKNITYIRAVLSQLESGVHIDYIKDRWYDDFKSDFERIARKTTSYDKMAEVKKMGEKIQSEYESILKDIIKYIKELISHEYNTLILKKNSSKSQRELMMKLRIARNELILFKKVIKLAYNVVVENYSRMYGVPEVIVRKREIPEDIINKFEQAFGMIMEGVEKDLKKNVAAREKSLKVGEEKELVGFFKKIIDEGLDLESYADKHSSILTLDDRELTEKLLALDAHPLKGKSICFISSVVYTIPQLSRLYVQVAAKYGSKLFNPPTRTNPIERRDKWRSLLAYIDVQHGRSGIMIPYSGGLTGGYGLFSIHDFLTENSRGEPYIRSFSSCIETNFPKSKMKTYNSIILVNFNSEDMIDKRTWRTVKRKTLEDLVKHGTMDQRYKFAFDLLFDPNVYKKNANMLWAGGQLLNNISLKPLSTYIVSFRCLASKLNLMVQNF